MMIAKVLNKKFFNCLWLSKFVDICHLRPATVPQVNMEVVKGVDIVLKIPSTLHQVIIKVVDLVEV